MAIDTPKNSLTCHPILNGLDEIKWFSAWPLPCTIPVRHATIENFVELSPLTTFKALSCVQHPDEAIHKYSNCEKNRRARVRLRIIETFKCHPSWNKQKLSKAFHTTLLHFTLRYSTLFHFALLYLTLLHRNLTFTLLQFTLLYVTSTCRSIRSVAVDPTNEWFVTGSGDRTIKFWDLASGLLKLTLTGHIEQVTGLAISERQPYMFSCALDKMVKCWDLEYNKVR